MPVPEPISPAPASTAAVAPPPTPARRGKGGIVAAVVASIVIILGGGCFALFRAASGSVNDAKPAAESFLSAIEKGDTRAAADALSAEARAKTDAEGIADIVALLAKRKGKPTGHQGPVGYFVETRNGVQRVRLTYTETFEQGETPVQLVLRREGGEWRVEAFNFQL